MPNNYSLKRLNKKLTSSNIIKLFAFVVSVVYIFEVLPRLSQDIAVVFSDSFIRLSLVVLVVCIAFFDLSISLVFVVLLILTHYSFVHRGFVGNVVSNVTSGASEVIRGASKGTQEIVVNLGSGVKNAASGLSQGASTVLGGVSKGAQNVVAGVGDGVQHAVRGTGSGLNNVLQGAQNVVTGVGDGVHHAIEGTETGLNNVLHGVQHGGQQLIGGLNNSVQDVVHAGTKGSTAVVKGVNRGAQQLLGTVQEGMEVQALSVDQTFQKYLANQLEKTDKGCSVNPVVSSTCDKVLGRNAQVNCSCGGKGSNCQCGPVSVWKNSLNTQGLNYPMGYSGEYTNALF